MQVLATALLAGCLMYAEPVPVTDDPELQTVLAAPPNLVAETLGGKQRVMN